MTTAAVPDADTCERLFYACLEAHDMRGVAAALEVMAPQDPHRAQHLYDLLQLAITIAQALRTPAAADE